MGEVAIKLLALTLDDKDWVKDNSESKDIIKDKEIGAKSNVFTQ